MAASRIRQVAARPKFAGVRDAFITQGYVELNEAQASLLMRIELARVIAGCGRSRVVEKAAA